MQGFISRPAESSRVPVRAFMQIKFEVMSFRYSVDEGSVWTAVEYIYFIQFIVSVRLTGKVDVFPDFQRMYCYVL